MGLIFHGTRENSAVDLAHVFLCDAHNLSLQGYKEVLHTNSQNPYADSESGAMSLGNVEVAQTTDINLSRTWKSIPAGTALEIIYDIIGIVCMNHIPF